ncbi:periplasmic binding protein-like I [Globomyces pollinis-pini]|nr:periplasmic binding protein-like I [Globomyces pollinis-pini]
MLTGILLLLISTLFHYSSSLSVNGTQKIKIGVNLGFSPSLHAVEAVILRSKQLNSRNDDLVSLDASIEIIFLDNLVSSSQTIENALELGARKVLGVIGSGFSRLSILNALITETYGIIQCDFCTNSQLSSKSQFPNFFRTIPTDDSEAAAIIGYIKQSGWERITLVYTNEAYGQGLSSTMTILSRAAGISIVSSYAFDIGGTAKQANDIMLNVQGVESKIIVFLGYAKEYGTVIDAAIKNHVFGKDYVWIASDGIADWKVVLPSASQSLIAGTLIFLPQEASGSEAIAFNEYWSQNRLYMGSNATELPSTFSYFASSCVDLMIHGFHRLLKSNDNLTVEDLGTGKLNDLLTVPESFQFPNLATPSGFVKSDENGDRIGNFDIFNIQPDGSSLIVSTWTDGKRMDLAPYYYPGGSSIQPKDRVIVEDIAIYAHLGGTLSILSIIFFVIVGLIWLVTFVGTIKYRNSIVIRKSSGSIGLVMQLALLLANFQFLIMIGKPTPVICVLDSFILPISFSAYYGVLLMKSFRLFRVLNFTRAKKWSNNKVVFYGLLWSVPTLAIVISWCAIDTSIPMVNKLSSSSYYWTCKSKEIQFPVIAALLIYNGFILLSNVLMAIQIRNIELSYNDSKLIGISIYNVSVIALFCCISLFSTSMSFDIMFLIKIISMFYVIMFNMLTTFSKPLYNAYHHKVSATDGSLSKTSDNVSITTRSSITLYNAVHGKDMFKKPNKLEIFGKTISLVQLRKVNLITQSEEMEWDLTKVKHLLFMIICPLMIQVEMDNNSYIIQFIDEMDANAWISYFKQWEIQIHKQCVADLDTRIKTKVPSTNIARNSPEKDTQIS